MIQKAIVILLCTIFVFFASVSRAHALSFEPNNKFGIHVATPSEHDIKDGAALVNTHGRWGYITMVLQNKDRDVANLQNICNILRENRLIPIFRLATQPQGDSWERPNKKDGYAWADTFSKVNCAPKDIYISLFNEVNEPREWGGRADAKDYADIALTYAKAFKAKGEHYRILLAALNQTHDNSAHAFLTTTLTTSPQLCNYLDGIASHSYPSNFVGPPTVGGFGTITGYRVEQEIYRSRCGKEFPVFIKETGWKNGVLPDKTLENYYEYAFKNVWGPDPTVRAVTLYDLNGSPPNTDFAFRLATQEVHGFSEVAQGSCPGFRLPYCFIKDTLAKEYGEPEQRYGASVLATLPRTVIAGSTYKYQVWVKNSEKESSDIWGKTDGYSLGIDKSPLTHSFSDFYHVRPGSSFISHFSFNGGNTPGTYKLRVCLFKKNVCKTELFSWDLKVVAPPRLTLNSTVFPLSKKTQGEEYELQVFRSRDEQLVLKQQVTFNDGVAHIPALSNVALDESYRVVLLGSSKAYLPVQVTDVIFKEGDNTVEFPSFFPIDFNGDGKFSLGDIIRR